LKVIRPVTNLPYSRVPGNSGGVIRLEGAADQPGFLGCEGAERVLSRTLSQSKSFASALQSFFCVRAML
jgi:hypothetical protein